MSSLLYCTCPSPYCTVYTAQYYCTACVQYSKYSTVQYGYNSTHQYSAVLYRYGLDFLSILIRGWTPLPPSLPPRPLMMTTTTGTTNITRRAACTNLPGSRSQANEKSPAPAAEKAAPVLKSTLP